MKRFFLTSFYVVLLLLKSSICWSTFKVYIDPGHGGSETGAVSKDLVESKLVLSISKELLALIEKNPSLSAQLSRTGDQTLSLEERTLAANAFQSDLFVSIHANSSPNPKYKGPEFYFQNTLPSTEESLYLANLENQFSQKTPHLEEDMSVNSEVSAILEDLKRQASMYRSLIFSRSLKDHWGGPSTIKQGPFFVISKQPYPSVLVEVGYLTNAQDRNLLRQKSHQKDLAQKIYNSILDYKLKVDKKGTKVLD